MDMTFECPSCKQQLETDSALAGSTIACPACGNNFAVPSPPADAPPVPPAAAAPEPAHKPARSLQVPLHDGPTESLIQKPKPPLSVAAKETDKKLRVKTIRRTDCVEVGKDHFDERVSELLGTIGEVNIVSITPIAYTHMDLGSRQLMTDFGVMIVYKG